MLAVEDVPDLHELSSTIFISQNTPEATAERLTNGKDFKTTTRNGKTLYTYATGQLWIPENDKNLQDKITYISHSLQGHGNARRTLAHIYDADIKWNNMTTTVNNFCMSCGTCILSRNNPNKHPHASELKQERQPQYRLQTLMADYLGPLEPSPQEIRPGHTLNCTFALVLQDKWSRYLQITATEAADGDNTISALTDFVSTYGAPHEFASDNGSHFKNNKLLAFLAKHNIKHVFGIPIHSQSQATVERAMNPIQKLMRAAALYGSGWAQHVNYIAYTYNTSYNRALKTSPYNMFYGQYPPSILKNSIDYPTTSPQTEAERELLAAEFSRLFEEAADSAFTERAKTQAKQTRTIQLEPHDYVTLWIANEKETKLQPTVDIRRVRERVSDSVYVIEQIDCDLKNGTDKNQEPILSHIDRLKKIPKPMFTRQQQKALTISQIKDGRGIIEAITGHVIIDHKFHLNIKWQGIEDADVIEHKIPKEMEPRFLYKSKLAQEYLQANGFKYSSTGGIIAPRKTADHAAPTEHKTRKK